MPGISLYHFISIESDGADSAKITAGMVVVRYVEVEADHFVHAENYCMLAS